MLALTCDQPSVTAFDAGVWGPVVRRRQVVVPYYPGAVHYLPQERLFARRAARLDRLRRHIAQRDQSQL